MSKCLSTLFMAFIHNFILFQNNQITLIWLRNNFHVVATFINVYFLFVRFLAKSKQVYIPWCINYHDWQLFWGSMTESLHVAPGNKPTGGHIQQNACLTDFLSYRLFLFNSISSIFISFIYLFRYLLLYRSIYIYVFIYFLIYFWSFGCS